MSKRIYIGDWDVSNSMRLDGDFVYSPFPVPFEVELLVVGGGGGGSTGYLYDDGEGKIITQRSGGAGGAGGMITGSFETNLSNSYNVTIGNGGNGGKAGTPTTNGQNSSFIGSGLSVTAYGGGGGADFTEAGYNGGSGGGGGYNSSTYSGGTATIGSFPSGFSGFGHNGGSGAVCTGYQNGGKGGGGGGAGGAGSASNVSCSTISGAGLQWVDGVTYAKGGGNNGSSNLNNTGWGGDIITGFTPTLGVKGAPGIVKLRYKGVVKATGGTITESDGWVYHTFTSNDTFEVISSVDT